MATVTLKNVTAQNTFWDGKGLSVVETETIKGREIKTYYSVFFDTPHNIQTGTTLSLEGKLSARLDEYTDKTGQARSAVKLTVNFPVVLDVQPGGGEFLTQQMGAVEMDNAPF